MSTAAPEPVSAPPRTAGAAPERHPRIHRGLTVAAIGFAAILPLFFDSGASFIDDATYALAYVIMALGLNVVVGFAGLLDLGYVAFFAIGPYTIGWFASSFFDPTPVTGGSAQP